MKLLAIPWLIICALTVSGCAAIAGIDEDERLAARQKNQRIAQTNLELGIAYLEQGKYEKSLEKLTRAQQANPSNAATYNVLGLLYQRIGEYARAETHFKRALKIAPQDAAMFNNYGQFLCRQDRPIEAEKIFLQAATNRLYETPELAYTNAGICAQKNGNNSIAEGYYRKALELRPDIPQALLSMSELTLEQNNYLSARGYLQRYQNVARHTPKSLWLGIRIEEILGDKDAVASYGLLLSNEFPDSQETTKYRELRGH